jgi:hypothetical protein
MMIQRFETSLEGKLIGNILKEYPQMTTVIERHFGGRCLERAGFKVQTLGMACILFGVDRKRLFKELEDFQIDRHEQEAE